MTNALSSGTQVPMTRWWRRTAAPLLAAVCLGGCARYATISEIRPRFLAAPPGTGLLGLAENKLPQTLIDQRRKPLEALSVYLTILEIASRELQRAPDSVVARRDYNFALGRIFQVLEQAHLDPWSAPLRVPAPGGDFLLTHQPDPRPQWNPALYDFIPADELKTGGTYLRQRTTRSGVGAALVAVGRLLVMDHRDEFQPPKDYYGVTAVARFGPGRRCIISFQDPLQDETTSIGGHTFPLAADFTAPVAVLLVRENPQRIGILRLLFPEKYAGTASLAMLQPYNPNKAVVVVVHGLMDTPASWTPMLNTLRGDPDIRRYYQFWYFSYPSGYPYPYSAAILRGELDRVEQRYSLRKPMILIGHSMGGCIARLMITDSGDKIWQGVFGKPPGQVQLSPASRKLFTESLIFSHRREVRRVIFIATPHRGSNFASSWVGRIGSSLVRAPGTLLAAGRDALHTAVFLPGELILRRIPNSVDTLAPNNRFVKVLNTIPITPGIPYHSIIGDRGRGDTPRSSDGVVPYWSSHLADARSELVVPSGHEAQKNPQAIAEVNRILKLNLKTGRPHRAKQSAQLRVDASRLQTLKPSI